MTALALATMAVAAPSASAQASAWSCDAFGYLFQTPTAGTNEIYRVDLASGQQTKLVDLAHPVNAVGFNQLDGFYYGRQNNEDDPATPTLSIVRVHSDGSVDDLGSPTGPGGTIPATEGHHVGDVGPDGHYWVANTVNWYEVDLTTPTPSVLRSGTFTWDPGLQPGGMADWAFVNGSLHALVSATVPTGPTHLARFDPATGRVIDLGPVGFSGGGIGAVFVDASGYLYGSQNANGNVYRVDTTTRATILASTGQPSGGNDGGRCASAPVPTITVTKTVNGRVRPADQFVVGLVEDTGRALDSATTSGTATTASTTNWPVSQGRTYTITDAMAPGSPTPLGEYQSSLACKDSNGNPVATGGTGPTWTLTVASATYYTCNVMNSAMADVVLEKRATSSPIVPGEDVTFSLRVTNNGPSTAVNETITDKLPAEVTFTSASPGCNEASGTVTCAVGDLAVGASKTFTITGQVASSLTSCLRNTATTAGATLDPNTSNNSSTICVPIVARSAVSMTKTASTQTVPAGGGQVMYTLVVRNNGPSDDPDVKVTDPLPAGLTLVAAEASQGSCTTANNRVACDLGALRNGGSAQVLVTTNTTAAPGCITNTAQAQGSRSDPAADDNRASAVVCVPAVPAAPAPEAFDLAVDKRAGLARPLVGQRLTYRVVVRNNGPGAAPAAEVTDTLNSPATLVSARTTQGTCTQQLPVSCQLGRIEPGKSVTVTMIIAPLKSGRVRNAASATSCCGTDSTPGNNMDTADVDVQKVPLRLTKVASRASVQAGSTLSYRIRVSNPSKGVARNVEVCDRLPSGLTFVSSSPRARRSGSQRCWTVTSLAAGKSRTFRVTVRAAKGASGRKVNRATVSSSDVKPATARRSVRVVNPSPGVTG
ncbi:DUF11 domain-containing protein [Solirubrobacter deserti]|uniref:DUF11 domain-containing protein n=1 Tax=Solirubrobacter deserti TaxID=2282478 RepID=A0ABT4RKG3_9ACTN|nr:DUF11 domain-containing protein [Solirubrobacter deserti]MDA0139021.1 DUF11 domain-containing protein [Solirubrobacter deserti]